MEGAPLVSNGNPIFSRTRKKETLNNDKLTEAFPIQDCSPRGSPTGGWERGYEATPPPAATQDLPVALQHSAAPGQPWEQARKSNTDLNSPVQNCLKGKKESFSHPGTTERLLPPDTSQFPTKDDTEQSQTLNNARTWISRVLSGRTCRHTGCLRAWGGRRGKVGAAPYLKFSAVLGTTSAKSSIFMRPTSCSRR